MKKLKVVTVVGTRPEIIRLSRVISLLNQTVDHVLIHTGQNYDYELNEIFFDDLGLQKPDYYLSSTVNSSSPCQTIANILSSIDPLLDKINPDAFLVLGDTNSCLSVIVAKRKKIPIFHMEAGNRCFDLRVPEEINRKIVDHTADINLTYSSIARSYLLKEGMQDDLVIKTGSPMFEVLHYYSESINNSNILDRLNLKFNNYFLVSIHREENVEFENSIDDIISLLSELASRFEIPVIVSTHPRLKNKISSDYNIHPLVEFHKPFGFFDYVNLQKNSKLVLSDSGTINEESSILGFNAVNLRQSHERPEGMEEATVMLTGLNIPRILQCVNLLQSNLNHSCKIVSDYDVPNVSSKVVRIIHSYVDYVNRVVWKKY